MDNIIFITGASSDIGVALIKSIKEECIIVAHYNSNNQRLLDLQTLTKNKIIPMQADFSSFHSLEKMLDEIQSEIGSPSKIIHLASPKFKYIRFKKLEWSDIENELNLSLRSLTQILNHFLPKMASKKQGRVIAMLSSVTIGVPPSALTQYTTVKYALLGYMKALASEFAGKNITFNCISPSMITTAFLSNIDERIVQLNAEKHPLKRNATVEDIIPTMLLLLSDDSPYVNGLNIPITGGINF